MNNNNYDDVCFVGGKLSLGWKQNIQMTLFGGTLTMIVPEQASPEGTVVKMFDELISIDGVKEILEKYGAKVKTIE
jgi:hypothetical protein